MKKSAVAVVALVCLVLGWSFSPWAGANELPEPPRVAPPAPAEGALATASEALARTPRTGEEAASTVRESVSAATGDALLTFVWKHDGSPASGLRVTVRPSATPEAEAIVGRADRLGLLRLEGLAPGDYVLHGSRLWSTLTLRAGQRVEQRLEVEAGLRCDGVVVDANGIGVEGADVFVQYFPDRSDAQPRWMARSGEGGTFRCATDFGGSFWARKAGQTASAIVTADDRGQVMLRLELRGPGALLRGRVVGADSLGVAAARVLALSQADPGTSPTPIEVATDPSGDFAFDELGNGPHLIVVEAEGHATSAVPIELQPGDGNRLDVRLGRGATIVGSVRDRGERALAAMVNARPAWAGSEQLWIEALRPVYLRCVARVGTAADGSYRLEHVPVGAVELFVDASRKVLDDRRRLTLAEGEVVRCDFWMKPSGAIRGRLVDPVGKPLAGWTVQYDPVGGGRAARGETDADGAFAEAGLDAERYRVTAAPPGAATSVPWAVAEDVQCGVDVLLHASCLPEQGAQLVGRALAGDGAPAQRVLLGLTPAGARQGVVREVGLSADGAFASGLLPVGRYRVTARIDDEGAVDLGERDILAGADVQLGEVRVPPCGMLELRFRNADGMAVAPDELRLFGAGGNRCETFDEVQDGGYRSAPVPAGRYTLVASGPDFVRVLQPVEVLAERTERVEVAVVVACTVRFELVAATPAAVARRLSLQVFDAQDRAGGGAGALLLEPGRDCTLRRGFAAGRYRCDLRDSGREVGGGTFEVGAAGEPEVVVRITVAD